MNGSVQAAPLWPLVVYFFLIIALMAAIIALSYVIGERHAPGAADAPFESGIVTVGLARLRLSAKFYLVAMFFVIFDVEALFLFAWAIAFREAGWSGYIEAVVFVAILIAALIYLWWLGALEWGDQAETLAQRRRDRNSHHDEAAAA
ncbi:MAG TPA: NADH-quinone oxidoreductase subunit A [Burkholderiales bacterium]|nr:NADH-quinone oxidoreductase subunit A [Burkholderiales bacterium]